MDDDFLLNADHEYASTHAAVDHDASLSTSYSTNDGE